MLQTHCAAEQMELVRLGAAVLWRMHHSRSPSTALLHAQIGFVRRADLLPGSADLPAAESGGGAGGGGGGAGTRGGGAGGSDSESEEEPAVGTPRAGSRDGANGGVSEAAGGGSDAQMIQTPLANFRLQGHAPFIDSVPKLPEPLSVLPAGSSHSELVVRALVAEAERLMTAPRPAAAAPPPTG